MAELTSNKTENIRHRTVVIFDNRPVSATGVSYPNDPNKRQLNITFQNMNTERERDYKLKLNDDEVVTLLKDIARSEYYNEVLRRAGLVRVAGSS